jgi:hypothetical protein
MSLRFLAACLLAWLAGCNNSVPTSPITISPPAPRSYVVSGILSETADGISRPLVGRQVFLRIEQPNLGRTEVVTTDQNGRYVAQVPQARVFASAWHPPDQQQPCLASAAVNEDTTLDVEVMPVRSSATPPPRRQASPLITGFVFEATPQGRNPLRGVHVSADASSDVWVAYTQTDDTGRFVLCRVNAPMQMVVSAGNGYQDWWQSIPGTGDMVLVNISIEGRRFFGPRPARIWPEFSNSPVADPPSRHHVES